MMLSGVVLLPDGARLAIALSRVECSGLSDGKRCGHSASAAGERHGERPGSFRWPGQNEPKTWALGLRVSCWSWRARAASITAWAGSLTWTALSGGARCSSRSSRREP